MIENIALLINFCTGDEVVAGARSSSKTVVRDSCTGAGFSAAMSTIFSVFIITDLGRYVSAI